MVDALVHSQGRTGPWKKSGYQCWSYICELSNLLLSCNNASWNFFPNPCPYLEIFAQMSQEWEMLLVIWLASMWVFMFVNWPSFPHRVQAYAHFLFFPTNISLLVLIIMDLLFQLKWKLHMCTLVDRIDCHWWGNDDDLLFRGSGIPRYSNQESAWRSRWCRNQFALQKYKCA